MNLITSSQNSLIKEIKGLKIRKNREEAKEFFIEGERFIEEAINEKADIKRIFLSSSFIASEANVSLLSIIEEEAYETIELPDKLFSEISDTNNPQGILAVLTMKDFRIKNKFDFKGFIVILESIQDPGNMGTIIRTADAAGCSCIILSKGCVDVYNPKVLRATMGSIFHVSMLFSDDLSETLKELKSDGFKVYASHLAGETCHFDVDMSGRTALIIGNEANGISVEIASISDVLLKIPMLGKAESLNASIAAGVMMFEAVRQRLAK